VQTLILYKAVIDGGVYKWICQWPGFHAWRHVKSHAPHIQSHALSFFSLLALFHPLEHYPAHSILY